MKIKLDRIDEELLCKKMSIQIGDKGIVTPLKARSQDLSFYSINELYRRFSLEKIDKCLSNEKIENKENRELKRMLGTDINFFILDYTDTEHPNDKQMGFLTDIQYQYSDAVITPTWAQIVRNADESVNLEEVFIDLTNRFIEIVETLNNKSIIGLIPAKLPRVILEPVIKNYSDKDITSFVIDLDGRSIDSNLSWIRGLMRVLKKYDLLEESLMYSINANQGKFLRQATEIMAKDFTNSIFGIDILGLNHIPPRISSDGWARIKSQRRENTYRMFNKDSYGYIRKTQSELNNSNISNRQELKIYNIEEQFKETLIIQNKLKEENTIKNYVETKSQVDEKFLGKIKKIKSDIGKKRTSLKSFF